MTHFYFQDINFWIILPLLFYVGFGYIIYVVEKYSDKPAKNGNKRMEIKEWK